MISPIYLSGQSSGETLEANFMISPDIALLGLIGNESNPLLPSPGVTYELSIAVNRNGDVTVAGTHDRFPAYEIWAYLDENDPVLVYYYDPREFDGTPWDLFSLNQVTIGE